MLSKSQKKEKRLLSGDNINHFRVDNILFQELIGDFGVSPPGEVGFSVSSDGEYDCQQGE